MENWGLITYEEDWLLIDTTFNAATAYARQLVAEIGAHELSHQWYFFFKSLNIFNLLKFIRILQVWKFGDYGMVECNLAQ